ncbi:hypothetical protein HQ560_21785, partial [bacterium]|nr:hypothetical protein [bacterium]
WAHWAWNLAYNISVKFPARPGRERWRWVEAGISILRDRGIPNNRKSILLYRELAWIYHHKIGQDADDAHAYYKVALAVQMQRAFGLPPYYGRIQAMANTVSTREELLKDTAVRDLVKSLTDAEADPFKQPLDVINRSRALPEPALALIEKEADSEAFARLELFLRARHIEDNLKLDFDRLLYYMEHFGAKGKPASIEWRLPSAHALYWAGQSVEVAGKRLTEAINSDRVFLYALQDQYRNGNLRFSVSPKTGNVLMEPSPNFDFIEPCLSLHREITRRHRNDAQRRPTHDNFLNFLREVVIDLFLHKGPKEASKYYRLLTKLGPESQDVPLEEFIESRLAENMKGLSRSHAAKIIQGLLYQSLVSLAFGHDERATRQYGSALWVKKRHDRERRITLPPVPEMLKNAIAHAKLALPDWAFVVVAEHYPGLVEQLKKEAAKEATPDKEDFVQPDTPREVSPKEKSPSETETPALE